MDNGIKDYAIWADKRIKLLEDTIQNFYNEYKCGLEEDYINELLEKMIRIKKGIQDEKT